MLIKEKTVVEGGHLEKASPSAISEYAIADGEIINRKMVPPEKIIYKLGKIEVNKKYPHPIMIKINDKQYWKFSE